MAEFIGLIQAYPGIYIIMRKKREKEA